MEQIFTICPLLRAIISGDTARVTYRSPLMLVSIIRSQSSRTPSWIWFSPTASPALLTNTSILRHSTGRDSMLRTTSSLSLTSKHSASTLMPCCCSRAALSSCSRSLRLPVTIRLYLFSAKISATALPIPDVAPVISAILFIKYSWLLNVYISNELYIYKKRSKVSKNPRNNIGGD